MESHKFACSATRRLSLLQGMTGGEVAFLVQQNLRAGELGDAVAMCEAARSVGVDAATVALSEALARSELGEYERALALADAVLAEFPQRLVALDLKAHILARLLRKEESAGLFQQVIDRFPDFPGAHGALASLLLPGRDYRDVLAKIHLLFRPETYLEIGIETGQTLRLAKTASCIAGVDPVNAILPGHVPRNAKLYWMTSDAFFSEQSNVTVFGGRRIDLAFIDGMHLFEYALRDFANAERWASADGTIVLHDCLPITRATQRRERESGFWTGDVWKLLEVLLDRRGDLKIRVVPTAPSGLVIVRGLKPSSTLLHDEMNSIVAEYGNREYPHTPGEWPARYGMVSNDDRGLAEVFGESSWCL
jgi:tetratricopeptide (TPR) repeat protein